ncbi:hypothetical protein FQN55_000504 [Onygenales sp. PD_40]|nr:hypothetical protein FQN55_000504 [Onygenales sp. PD_40]KAK2779549.1 hypothetical protein FQN52_002417 [Onygenales sp. PD_12]KAK2799210.1 hypothetical protein FQN51_007040 [Onygenales sp. PD_10]
MFSSSLLSNLPHIETRKALLLLDFQNDFVKPDGALFVRNVPDFLDTVAHLAERFRETGDVIWVQTQFEQRRSIFDPENGGEVVVIDKSSSSAHQANTSGSGRGGVAPNNDIDSTRAPPTRTGTSGDSRRTDDRQSAYPDDPEAFLSVPPKPDSRRCCVPRTPGCQFPARILSAIDHDRDTVLVKSEYSAFQSESLLLSFRTQFVTELFICGSLSNVSVYATALDAVRHGLAVTLVEDCLGFRSFARHEEAMRRMADMMGANGITSAELTEEQDWEEAAVPTSEWPEQSATSTPVGIEGEMDVLAVKSPPKPGGSDDHVSEDDDDALEFGKTAFSLARARSERAAKATRDGAQPKPRMRKQRRPASKDGNADPESNPQPLSPGQPESPEEKPRAVNRSKKQKNAQPDVLGPDDSIGEGDSRIVYDLNLPSKTFKALHEEVNWQKMYHMSGQVPRLVAVQGAVQSDNSIPIYRHPADESPPLFPFSKTVNSIRQVVEKHLGHPLNHVLIQLYRDGQDRISEHSDKTLDIVRGSYICNVSLGAKRTMTLRTKSSAKAGYAREDDAAPKEGRQSQKVPMPHNSLFILGEQTNMRWLHAIRADKRPESEKSEEELAFGGERISLTFRQIGTFTNPEADTIWGQGAISKSKESAGKVVHGESTETERMIKAFGQENQQSEFDWEDHYGQGFDVVNFVTAATGKLLLSGDAVADLRVKLCFAENGIRYDVVSIDDFPSALRGTLSLPHKDEGLEPRPVFMDLDGATVITGDDSILTTIAKQKGLSPGETPASPGGIPQKPLPEKLREIDVLFHSWRKFKKIKTPHGVLEEMDMFEKLLRGKSYHAGRVFGIEDCALWPVLRDIIREVGPLDETRFPSLSAYYQKVAKRGCVKAVLEEMVQGGD